MLISFSVSNWKSIRDELSLSLMAGREERFKERLPQLEKLNARVLPITAIYGANASGKSVLISALTFAQRFILFGSEPGATIDLKPFLLDEESKNKPSVFSFVISIHDVVYEYSFSLSKTKVLYESLKKILKTTTHTIFERKATKKRPEISIQKVPPQQKKDLSTIAALTSRDNQLFLTSTIYQGLDYFQDIHDWFKKSLMIITPDMYYRPVSSLANLQNKELYEKLLNNLDTGIVELALSQKTISGKEAQELYERFKDELQTNQTLMIENSTNDRRVMELSQDEVLVKTLIPRHLAKDSKLVDFSFSMESDGTNRLLDILPAFALLKTQKGITIVIDELDRSLHTKLSKALIVYYLNSCNSEGRNQLIFTTHDVMLMDQDLFRRDELCLIERDAGGASSLYCMSDYKDIRFDKDIRKSYLHGNLGGIPNIFLHELCDMDENEVNP